jgi:ATP/maltotriose-dependent transcriptional regulator MalT
MTQAEAADVLRGSHDSAVSGLVALAHGWPAVIGLAALAAPPFDDLNETVPETLHAYFAEELYQAVPERLKEALLRLSLTPTITPELATEFWGDEAERFLSEASSRGFLTHYRSREFDLHPLLRQFLRAKIDVNESWVLPWVRELSDFLLARRSWDDLFALFEEIRAADLLDRIIETGLGELIAEGRIETVRRWLSAGRELGFESPQLDLAEAEICFREAQHSSSEALAMAAAEALPPSDPLRSRAFYRAAQSAHMDDRSQTALQLYERAAATATDRFDRNQANWGRFITQVDLGMREDAISTMKTLAEGQSPTAEERLRNAQAQLVIATRWGGIRAAVSNAKRHRRFLDKSRDALVRTAFLHMFGGALCLSAEYTEALEQARAEEDEARRVGLEFVLPHVGCLRIHAEVGLRRFADASRNIRKVRAKADELDDDHSWNNSRVLQAMMLLARGLSARAIEVLDVSSRPWPNPGLGGEVLAMRALASAVDGQVEAAQYFAAEAAELSEQIEALMPRLWSHAIVEYRRSGDTNPTAEAFERAWSAGHLDSIVCAYRSFPPLIRPLTDTASKAAELTELFRRSADYHIARKAGLNVTAPTDAVSHILTEREREVLGLLRQGYSNAEIARALWIENSTAKVHVRHILRKLGVRTRTEAAVLASADHD